MECRLERIVQVGRSALILGRVVMWHVRDDLMKGGSVDPHLLTFVGRLGDDYYTEVNNVFEKKRED